MIGKNENSLGALPTAVAGAVHAGGDKKISTNSRRAIIGGGLTGVAMTVLCAGAPGRAQAGPGPDPGQDHAGPLSSATISFGSWMPPVDRFPNLSPRLSNHHELCPDDVTIRRGGCVNFVIAGFHLLLVYDDGTQPGDLDATLLISPTAGGPPLMADPNRRIYRGLDPSLQTRDRVEVVHFDTPGTYLVICGVLRHFLDGMYGFVRVLP